MLKQILKTALPVLLGLACLGPFLFGPKTALATSPTTINFQGKVVNPNGTNVADNTSPGYTFVFRLYNSATPTISSTCLAADGCLWSESDTVPVSNSIFQVELGNNCPLLTANGCNFSTPIDFSSNSLYLTMNFNGDTDNSNGRHGYMYPLIHFTGVPYAYYSSNSASLGGIAAANYVQLATGNLQADSSTNNAIAINKTGASGNILLLETNSKAALTVNNSGALLLGQAGASGLSGILTFQNSTDSSTASLTFTGNSIANYTYQLPTGTVSSNSCLQSGTVSSGTVPLTFGSCGSGGGTFATIYSITSQASNTVTYSNNGGGALVLQDAATPLSNLFTIENNAATFNYLAVTLASSVPHLRVYGASSSNYADIYYDSSTSTAIFAASSGTTQIGAGTGNITFNMTASANAETHNHIGSPAAGYTATDYTFTRNLTGTTFALQGNVLSILDTSSFTSGSSSPNLLYINQNNTSATGNLILAQTGGSTTKFSVDTAGNLTVVGTAGITGNTTITGSLQVQSASGITIGTTSNAGLLALYNGSNKVQIQGASSTTAYNFVLPASAGAVNQCLVNTSTAGTLQWLPCGAGSTATVTLSPEFPGAVLTPANTLNPHIGTMTSDFCSGSGSGGLNINASICGTGSGTHNYYSWTDSNTQTNDYDVWTEWQVPSDFSSISSITFYGWTTGTSDSVSLSVYNAGTLCGSSSIVTTSTAFTSTTVSTSSCTGGSAITAGNELYLDGDLEVGTNGHFARLGEIVIVYNRK